MSHTLVEIPRAKWPELRDLYENHKERTCSYNLLQCLIEWAEQNAKVVIFSLDGDYSDGTFVACSLGPLVQVFCNTISNSDLPNERLCWALSLLINEGHVEGKYLIFGFPQRILKTVMLHIRNQAIPKTSLDMDATHWYYIEREKVLKFDVSVPAGLTIRRLELEHAEQVNNVWPHRSPGSIFFVMRLIRYNDSVGVFDEAGVLRAWVLRLPIGSMGLLQVEEPYKRQGLGSLVVRYMSKLMASKNIQVTAPVVLTNKASQAMFEKLGFKIIDSVYWTMVPDKSTVRYGLMEYIPDFVNSLYGLP